MVEERSEIDSLDQRVAAAITRMRPYYEKLDERKAAMAEQTDKIKQALVDITLYSA